MGPPQRIAGPAPTAFSQDPLWVCLREQNSLVKNRMRGIRTSGSVKGGDGNIPTYSTLLTTQADLFSLQWAETARLPRHFFASTEVASLRNSLLRASPGRRQRRWMSGNG